LIDQETFDDLLPLACQWARVQEDSILSCGVPLDQWQVADAKRVGVRDWSRVRVLVVDRIPMPENDALAKAAQDANIINSGCRGVAIGHGIIIRADRWGDRELLLHQLVHVAQCERSGGLTPFVQEYLSDRRNCPKFTVGAFEEEARRIAREICAARVLAG
jgi:hypothetical protein